MSLPDMTALLPEAEAIARRAGAEIMKYYGRARVSTKDDGSAVTEADLAAESIILPALEALTPHIPIVSEERVAAGDMPDIAAGTFWTVDPIDGTREFTQQKNGFVVAIALLAAHRPVLGLVYHPSLDLLYTGHGPGTASKTLSGKTLAQPLETIPKTSPGTRVLVNGGWSDMPPIHDYLSRRAEAPIEIDSENAGGIFRPCRVAEGHADMTVIYANHPDGRIAFWDVAPGHAILEAAGGRVETLQGAALPYTSADFYTGPHAMLSPVLAATKK